MTDTEFLTDAPLARHPDRHRFRGLEHDELRAPSSDAHSHDGYVGSGC